MVDQNGSGNNAGITQDGTVSFSGAVTASITQRGALNDATIRQLIATTSTATVEQNGIANLARLEQLGSGDTRIQATQNGIANRLAVRQIDSGLAGPHITQNGDGNTAVVLPGQYGRRRHEHPANRRAEQCKHRPDRRYCFHDHDPQLGWGDRPEARQTGDDHVATIDQNGINNFASVTQNRPLDSGLGNTASLIAQLGYSNSAIVRQNGLGYVANVNQAGSANWTSIYQH